MGGRPRPAGARPVGIVSQALTIAPSETSRNAPEMVFEVARRAVESSGLGRGAIELTVSGSSDVLDGRSFGFAHALEALGVWPPSLESHLEMDGAWAAYYAYLKILAGEARSALVVAWGKSSEASLHHVTNNQLDPFCLAPLGLDAVATAALQADAWMDRAGQSVGDLDAVAMGALTRASRNASVSAVLARAERDEPVASPLWRRHCARPADGACAIVMAAEDVASRSPNVAWVVGADHRAEPGAIGCRDLACIPGAAAALRRARAIAGRGEDDAAVDVAEVAASFAHQEPMLAEALGLDGARINPSGGALAADPMMATGLIRLAECALQVTGAAGGHQVDGARRGLAHASSGHALQHNLVWLLEGMAS